VGFYYPTHLILGELTQTVLWYPKVWCSASTFVVQSPSIANLQNVRRTPYIPTPTSLLGPLSAPVAATLRTK